MVESHEIDGNTIRRRAGQVKLQGDGERSYLRILLLVGEAVFSEFMPSTVH